MGNCHPLKNQCQPRLHLGRHWFSQGDNFSCYPLVQSIIRFDKTFCQQYNLKSASISMVSLIHLKLQRFNHYCKMDRNICLTRVFAGQNALIQWIMQNEVNFQAFFWANTGKTWYMYTYLGVAKTSSDLFTTVWKTCISSVPLSSSLRSLQQ